MTGLCLPIPTLTSLFATSTALLVGDDGSVPDVTHHIASALVLFEKNPEYADYRPIIEGFKDVSLCGALTRDELAEDLFHIGNALGFVTCESAARQSLGFSMEGLRHILRSCGGGRAPKPVGTLFDRDADHVGRDRDRMLSVLAGGVYHDVAGIVSGLESIFPLFSAASIALVGAVGTPPLRERVVVSVTEVGRRIEETLRMLMPIRLALHFSMSRSKRRRDFLECFRNGAFDGLQGLLGGLSEPLGEALRVGAELVTRFESQPLEEMEADVTELRTTIGYLMGRQNMLRNGVELIQNLKLFHDGMDDRIRGPVSLHDAIDPLIIKSLLGKRIELVIALEKDPAPVMGPLCQLAQLVYNLVLNAYQAIPSKGTLEILTERTELGQRSEGFVPDPYMKLTIRDTGVGIPAEMIPNIFEPGVSGKGSSGMGLYVIREIIHDMGGFVQVKTSTVEPKGTSFSLYLPAMAS